MVSTSSASGACTRGESGRKPVSLVPRLQILRYRPGVQPSGLALPAPGSPPSPFVRVGIQKDLDLRVPETRLSRCRALPSRCSPARPSPAANRAAPGALRELPKPGKPPPKLAVCESLPSRLRRLGKPAACWVRAGCGPAAPIAPAGAYRKATPPAARPTAPRPGTWRHYRHEETQPLRDPFSNRTFSGASRAIDSNNQALLTPRLSDVYPRPYC